MCGIAAILSLLPEQTLDPQGIRKMCQLLAHRGPDDEGYFVRPQIQLGNRRLSVIDLEGGKQPVSTQNGRYTIVFNGEIFNYRQLRAELKQKGEVFRTESDTEVVLLGFAKEGIRFLDRLNGMFAFLIYDLVENKLYAARDGFGIKPLYMYHSKEILAFASEIRCFKALRGRTWELNEEAVSSYFSIGYSLGRETFFKGVHRIPPGTVVSVSLENFEMIEEVFVNRLYPPTLAIQSNIPTHVEKKLISAIDDALVSDVPVGLYLSGGIDSSYIASVVSKELHRTLKSFSVSFPKERTYDESNYSSEVAKHLSLEHETVPFYSEELLDLRGIVRQLEEPLADPNAAALLKLSELARKEVKVVLSGEGGDELFGGYPRYFWDRFSEKFSQIPWTIRKLVLLTACAYPSPNFRRRVRKLNQTMDLERPHRWMSWFSPFAEGEHPFLGSALLEGKTAQKFFGAFHLASPLSSTAQAQWVDLVTYLRDALLMKADKVSMAHSLEVRVPFLQPDVVAAAFSLPQAERSNYRSTKPYLRKLLSKYLPESITNRKKQGFEMPLDAWFRGPLKPVLETHLSKEKIEDQKRLNGAVVEKIRKEHLAGKQQRGLALYSLSLFNAWCDEYL